MHINGAWDECQCDRNFINLENHEKYANARNLDGVECIHLFEFTSANRGIFTSLLWKYTRAAQVKADGS